jgi:Asp-tRNA(Asn)/Glu-tRNA(Gln) amidotransferase A subunit family amidase
MSMLLDTIADPGPLEAGEAYRLDLPARPAGAAPYALTGLSCKEHVHPDQLAWPGIETLPGLPSTAIPTGFAPDGPPVGVQIVGPWLDDPTPLKLAELIEREFGSFVPPKMFHD